MYIILLQSKITQSNAFLHFWCVYETVSLKLQKTFLNKK